MKKIFILISMLVFLCSSAYATSEIINGEYIKKAQARVDQVGFKLLNYNGIEKRTVFDFDTRKTKNAYSRSTDRQIVIYRGLYNRLDSDDELAAVLAHEIAHSVDSYKGICRGLCSSWSYYLAPKKYEYKADKKAVDYMVNANYNIYRSVKCSILQRILRQRQTARRRLPQ